MRNSLALAGMLVLTYEVGHAGVVFLQADATLIHLNNGGVALMRFLHQGLTNIVSTC